MVENQDMVIIFKVVKLNNDLEQLIPTKVAIGEHCEDNTFIDSADNTIYKHIVNKTETGYLYGKRTVVGTISEEKLKKLKEDRLKYYKKYTMIRFKDAPSIIYMTFPGADIMEYDDIDCDSQSIEFTPKEIEERVKNTVVGQDEAVRKIVVALWMTFKFPKIKKRNMLVIGPTGVGKTLIFEKLQEILDIPLVIFAVPGLSQAGYIGRSTDEILKQIYFECDGNEDCFSRAIVVLDELDKIAYNNSGTGEVSTVGVQSELLKIIEGVKRNVEINNGEDDFDIDTSKIVFVGVGAFSEILDDKKNSIGFNAEKEDVGPMSPNKIIKYGLKRELVGRLPVIVELETMTKEKLKSIILHSDESELENIVEALQELGVAVNNLDEIIDIIVEDAMERKIGARGLVTTINNIFMEVFYEVANSPGKYGEVYIGKNILNDKTDFKLTPKKVKKRTKKEIARK